MSFGPLELVLILAIVAVLFGTKRLRSIGSDLGSAIRGFRGAMKDDSKPDERVIEGEVEKPSETK